MENGGVFIREKLPENCVGQKRAQNPWILRSELPTAAVYHNDFEKVKANFQRERTVLPPACGLVPKKGQSAQPNRGVEKYRSAVSGRTVTTVLPLPSFLARAMAAATLVPLEIPQRIPSLEARSREV